jgi:predicted nucleotidyltransferase
LVADTVSTLAARHKEALLAVVLFGSVARHEERPLDDARPSDVDLLAVFNRDTLPLDEQLAIFTAVGEACTRHLDALREVNVLPVTRTLSGWDPTFVANVAHDGIVLYLAGDVPALHLLADAPTVVR